MNTAEIAGRISHLKKCGKVLTNCYVNFSLSDSKEYETFGSEKTLIIINREYKVSRIRFYTLDIDDFVDTALKNLTGEEYTLDIVSKDPLLFRDEFGRAGFSCIAEMMRLSNNNISEVFSSESPVYKYCGCEYGQKAQICDAQAIFDTLWSVFDTRISHLPDKESVISSIEAGEFLVHKNSAQQIVSLLQTVAAPKQLYINQVYNSAEREIIHGMLLGEIKRLCESGGNYLYSWVEKNNIASMKFHGKYNLKHDGLWDIVYVINGEK